RADMPAEVKAALASGLRANAEHRQGLIRTIKACKRNTFADEELGAMTDRALERLADLAGPAGQGATLRRVDPLTGQPARYHLAAPSLPSGGDEPKEPYRPPLMFSRAKEG
ncbi:MAG: hypothetical protein R3349_03920, partial [Geminicoccaceae bacterium]|nr:hypothetical protein [Geminicoccaceae bacterium]